MRQTDIQLSAEIAERLNQLKAIVPMPGINSDANFNCLIKQIVDSIRRIRYVRTNLARPVSDIYCDATHGLFHPRKAAIWQKQNGNIEEAFWLIFLSVHFGKNLHTKYQLVSDVYNALGNHPFWTWDEVNADPVQFKEWLQENRNSLRGHFGNHRKYQSLDAHSPAGTGRAFETYVEWVAKSGSHVGVINNAIATVGKNRRRLFDYLYHQMNIVSSFGRTARFDYLTMIGKLDLADIEPGSTYMSGATGPLGGARLLFGNNVNRPKTPTQLSELLDQMDRHLGLYFGMQVLEDALCNWQKSPDLYVRFNG